MEPIDKKNPIIVEDKVLPVNFEVATGQLETNFFQNFNSGASPLTRPIQSSNYKTGTSGWRLDTSGTVEINGNVPASTSAYGIKGMIAFSTTHIYVCTATNTWKRVAISTW
jgi:hypothetical protein